MAVAGNMSTVLSLEFRAEFDEQLIVFQPIAFSFFFFVFPLLDG